MGSVEGNADMDKTRERLQAFRCPDTSNQSSQPPQTMFTLPPPPSSSSSESSLASLCPALAVPAAKDPVEGRTQRSADPKPDELSDVDIDWSDFVEDDEQEVPSSQAATTAIESPTPAASSTDTSNKTVAKRSRATADQEEPAIDLTALDMTSLNRDSADAYSESSIAKHGHPSQRKQKHKRYKQSHIFRTADGPRYRTLSAAFRPQVEQLQRQVNDNLADRPGKRVRIDESLNEHYTIPEKSSSIDSDPIVTSTTSAADMPGSPDDEISILDPPAAAATGTLLDTMSVTKQHSFLGTPPRRKDSINPHLQQAGTSTPPDSLRSKSQLPPFTPPRSSPGHASGFEVPPNPYLPRDAAPHRLANCSQLIPSQYRVIEALTLLNKPTPANASGPDAFYLYAMLAGVDPLSKVLKLSDIYSTGKSPYLFAKYFPLDAPEMDDDEDGVEDELVCGQEHYQQRQRDRQQRFRPRLTNSSHGLKPGMMVRLLLVARSAFQRQAGSTTTCEVPSSSATDPTTTVLTPLRERVNGTHLPPTPISPAAAIAAASTPQLTPTTNKDLGRTSTRAVDCFWLTTAADWDEVHALAAARVA